MAECLLGYIKFFLKNVRGLTHLPPPHFGNALTLGLSLTVDTQKKNRGLVRSYLPHLRNSFEEEGVIGISIINIHMNDESIHSHPSLLIHWGVHPKFYLFIYLFLLLLRSHFDGLITISFEALDAPKRTLEMLQFGFQFIVDIHKNSTFDKAYIG